MTQPAVTVGCVPSGGGWICTVRVGGSGPPTRHEVTVRAEDFARLAPRATDPTDLVHRSFAFLLEREPKTSILRRFDLMAIGRFFPEFEAEIRV